MTQKFIFLTGGAKRIGKTTCQHFHNEGFNIIFHYNSSESEANEIKKTLNEIRKDSCFTIQANFDDKSSIKKILSNQRQHSDKNIFRNLEINIEEIIDEKN